MVLFLFWKKAISFWFYNKVSLQLIWIALWYLRSATFKNNEMHFGYSITMRSISHAETNYFSHWRKQRIFILGSFLPHSSSWRNGWLAYDSLCCRRQYIQTTWYCSGEIHSSKKISHPNWRTDYRCIKKMSQSHNRSSKLWIIWKKLKSIYEHIAKVYR